MSVALSSNHSNLLPLSDLLHVFTDLDMLTSLFKSDPYLISTFKLATLGKPSPGVEIYLAPDSGKIRPKQL